MNEELLEPLKFYDTVGRQRHAENVLSHLEGLIKKSGVNEEENRATVRKMKEELAAAEKVGRTLAGWKFCRVMLILLAVLGGVLLIYGIAEGNWALPVVGVLLAVGCILLIVKKINPLIKSTEKRKAEHEEIAGRYREEAVNQMAPLNALFRGEDTFRLIEKTIPDFVFTPHFTKQNEVDFLRKYDFPREVCYNASMTDTVSGTFAGNPFLFGKQFIQEMGTETYTGSLTIHWTETYVDSGGRTRTRSRSQTLYASVTKPKPVYRTENYLCYGNQAAPDLSFSREPKHIERLSDGIVDLKVRSGKQKLARKTKKALTKGGTFQEMSNAEFDVLFGALDRNHEVQFRLMYTPLAQTNTVALLRNKDGYGDDFRFVKARRYNVIRSDHAQGWDMSPSADRFRDLDIDEARRKFTNYNNGYFQSLFFDFAPLFAVPAYLEKPTPSLDPIEEYDTSFPEYEHEVMANAMGGESFKPAGAITPAILKTRPVEKQGESDRVEVTAFAFAGEWRTDIVNVWGGDGCLHGVPVQWLEYIPVSSTKDIRVSKAQDFGAGTKYHGLSAEYA